MPLSRYAPQEYGDWLVCYPNTAARPVGEADERAEPDKADSFTVSQRQSDPYDTPAEVNGYIETVRAGALDGVNLDGVIFSCNHNMSDVPLARSPKTLTLTTTGAGLEFKAILPDTEQGRGVYTAVKRGDLTKMSFMFAVADGGEILENNTRTITKIERIFEISAVNFPAYADTAVYARNKEVKDMQNYNPITGAAFDNGADMTGADYNCPRKIFGYKTANQMAA